MLYWKSNIANVDEFASEDDEDMRSICSFVDTPQINSFNADKIKTTRSKVNGVSKMASNGHPGQVNRENAITEEGDAIEVKCESSSPSSSGKSTPINNENNTVPQLDFSCVDILKSILQQLEVITDSIVNIDQRLSTLEESMEKPSV